MTETEVRVLSSELQTVRQIMQEGFKQVRADICELKTERKTCEVGHAARTAAVERDVHALQLTLERVHGNINVEKVKLAAIVALVSGVISVAVALALKFLFTKGL